MTTELSRESAQALRSHGQAIVIAAASVLLAPDLMRYCSNIQLQINIAEKKEDNIDVQCKRQA